MKTVSLFLLLALFSISCNWAKEKAKETVNKTGEIVAKTGSEFVNGVDKGVQKTFSNQLQLSDALIKAGIKTGRNNISSSDSATDNIISVYLMFENDFNQKIIVKVVDENNLEYGRVTQMVIGKKGEGKYFEFTFDKRTNIDSKGKIIFE